MAMTQEEQETVSKLTGVIIDSFVDAIDEHVEDPQVVDLIKSQAGLAIMTKTLEVLVEEQKKLVARTKAGKQEEKYDNRGQFFPGATGEMTFNWPDDKF